MPSPSISASKIIGKEDFISLRRKLKEEGKKIIHCHGVFDLLHPGHIAHLEEAKSFGDVLVVTVTSAPYVNKGPGRPYFSDELRMKSLASLACIDYVLLSEAVTVTEIMEYIEPDLYIKGAEYARSENDVTQNIDREVEKVRSLGGDVHFTNGVVFSSTKLINNNFPVMPPRVADFSKEFIRKFSFDTVREAVDRMNSLKILVVGDIIIDEYNFCKVQGLMSKDRGFSAKYIGKERYLGGSLAVAKHISGFSSNVTVCGIVGNEPSIHSKILNDLSKDMFLDLCFDDNFQTIIKRRYIEQRGIRNEFDKLFSVNYLEAEDKSKTVDKRTFYNKLINNISDYDVVVVTDYGHGLIDRTVMDIVQEKAKFLAVNCQTNSSNYGMNLITKYKKADTFTLDEREIRLAYSDSTGDLKPLLIKLKEHLNAQEGWLTIGSLGAIGVDAEQNISTSPAMTLTVQDTVGAGDAFYALASLCAATGAPVDIGSFLGNVAGALAANIMGNSKSVSKVDVLKYASTLLNI